MIKNRKIENIFYGEIMSDKLKPFSKSIWKLKERKVDVCQNKNKKPKRTSF